MYRIRPWLRAHAHMNFILGGLIHQARTHDVQARTHDVHGRKL